MKAPPHLQFMSSTQMMPSGQLCYFQWKSPLSLPSTLSSKLGNWCPTWRLIPIATQRERGYTGGADEAMVKWGIAGRWKVEGGSRRAASDDGALSDLRPATSELTTVDSCSILDIWDPDSTWWPRQGHSFGYSMMTWMHDEYIQNHGIMTIWPPPLQTPSPFNIELPSATHLTYLLQSYTSLILWIGDHDDGCQLLQQCFHHCTLI